jgi:hypothetical protein
MIRKNKMIRKNIIIIVRNEISDSLKKIREEHVDQENSFIVLHI